MLFSKEYVGYLAREVTKKLIAGKFIETAAVPAVTERVNVALVERPRSKTASRRSAVILEAYHICATPAPTTRRCSAR